METYKPKFVAWAKSYENEVEILLWAYNLAL